MPSPALTIFKFTLIAVLLALTPAHAGADTGKDHAFFESRVRPILVNRCYHCHSEESGKQKGGLWLDRREGWRTGGDSGPALAPGNVEKSLLVRAIRYLDEDFQMPPKAKLPADEIATLEKWIAMGAPDPREAQLTHAVRREAIDYEAARQNWAFRSHQKTETPGVADTAWGRDPLDAFVLSGIENRSLAPAPPANPADLLRRLHYDLNGLPPTPEEVAAYAADPSEAAYAGIVDDLLARPAFGEKWGRHWLDVARYADSNGGDRNFTFFQAWRYRNYVIDSFNRDRPYYEFVRQQLAGDLMTADADTERRDQLIGSTFLALGPKMLTERDKEKLRLDTADEQIDTVGRAFLGLTLGCARCHDHKFDPVSQEDYYALAGIFRSTQVVMGTRNGCVNVASWVEQTLPISEPQRSELAARMERLELAMRLTVEKSFMKKAGGKMTLDKLPLAGVLYDEADAEKTGTWKKSTLFPSRFGKEYIHDDKKDKGKKRVVFRGSLPENGVYEVRVAYNGGGTRANNVPVTVEAWDEVHKITLDQTKTPAVGGLFEPIGRYRFEKGGRVNVIIETTGTKGFVIVDAVQFIAEADIEREAMALAAVEGYSDGEKPLLTMSEGELKKELAKMLKELRGADLAMAPRDADDAGDIHLRVRGETSQLGKLVARNFPKLLHRGPAPAIPESASGRLELAHWITSPDNALLDRVMANRIWHHLFDRGIVATVDNFGAQGEEPTHPELLDYLASEFRASGGSVKQLVRRIVTSSTYRLSADASGALRESDPQNTLFARQNRRRLAAEEIRDSVLFLSGQLETKSGHGTAQKHGDDLDKPMDFAKDTLRTVYLPVARNNLVAELATFDAANPDLVSGRRPVTTVPTQALYLLNSEFLKTQANLIGEQALIQSAGPDERIAWLYQKILSRAPSEKETKRARTFLESIGNDDNAYSHLAHLLIASTEFLFLN